MPKRMDKATRERKEMIDRMRAQIRARNSIYYWVFGFSRKGKRLLRGAFNSEQEANQWAYAKTNGDFEIIPLNVTSATLARQKILAMREDQFEDIDDTLGRLRHQGRGIDY